ncbi:hypothetical protein BDR06DRAFT_969502 [Suillus hirtellus]|nr:hypothetical protein BDR06DRAFT_969502 [Suillus hirtellus]
MIFPFIKPNTNLQRDQLAQNVRNENQKLICTTTSPIPDNLKEKHYALNGGLATIICEDQEQGEVLSLQDQEGDETDIMQEIYSSGILEWNPQVSWAAMHIAHDGLNGDQEIIEKSRDSSLKGTTQENSRSKEYRPRRPRGRPARKPTTQRSKVSNIVPLDKSSSAQDVHKSNSRYLIWATSNPVHDSQQARTYHMDQSSIHQNVIGDILVDTHDDIPCMEECAFRKPVPPTKSHRGHPKKRVRHARVTGQ